MPSILRIILGLPMSEIYTSKDGRKFTIREMKLSDAEDILEHVRSLAEERIFMLLEPEEAPKTPEDEENILKIYLGENRRMFVAIMDGKIVGTVDCRIGNLRKTSHTASIGIAVRKGYRGIGIGRALMNTIIRWADQRGVEKIWLSVFSTNKRAINFYESLGFRVECIRKRQFKMCGKYIDEVIMEKWIR